MATRLASHGFVVAVLYHCGDRTWSDEAPRDHLGVEWGHLGATMPGWESWQARLHAASQGRPAYRVDLRGAWHVRFANACEALPILYAKLLIPPANREALRLARCGAPLPTSEAHRIVMQYLVAFLKTNLAREAWRDSSR